MSYIPAIMIKRDKFWIENKLAEWKIHVWKTVTRGHEKREKKESTENISQASKRNGQKTLLGGRAINSITLLCKCHFRQLLHTSATSLLTRLIPTPAGKKISRINTHLNSGTHVENKKEQELHFFRSEHI